MLREALSLPPRRKRSRSHSPRPIATASPHVAINSGGRGQLYFRCWPRPLPPCGAGACLAAAPPALYGPRRSQSPQRRRPEPGGARRRRRRVRAWVWACPAPGLPCPALPAAAMELEVPEEAEGSAVAGAGAITPEAGVGGLDAAGGNVLRAPGGRHPRPGSPGYSPACHRPPRGAAPGRAPLQCVSPCLTPRLGPTVV